MPVDTVGLIRTGVNSVKNTIQLIPTSRIPTQIHKPVVVGNVILVAGFQSRRARADECLKDKSVYEVTVPSGEDD